MPTGRKDQRRGGEERRGAGAESEDLKRREYKDRQGNIHHHTREYMKEHEGKKKE